MTLDSTLVVLCRYDFSVASNYDFRSPPIPIYEFCFCGTLLRSSSGYDTFARIMYCFATFGDFRLTSTSVRMRIYARDVEHGWVDRTFQLPFANHSNIARPSSNLLSHNDNILTLVGSISECCGLYG